MRFTATRVSLLCSALAGSAFGLAPAAYAQDAGQAAQEEEADSTIFVTARKREEDLIDVPLPVTVATAEQLARDQVYNVNDLARITPALEISQTSGGETNGGGRLRGVGTGVFNPSVASSVALVIDQVAVGNTNFPLLYDLAQVEVLRGPQGTLFGTGASGGVINVTTGRPDTDALSVSAGVDFADKGTLGSEVGELIARAAINVPLGDMFAVRVATQFKRETGLQRSVTTGENNVLEDWAIRGRLLFEPTDTFSALLSAEHGESTSDGQTFFAVAIAPNSPVIFDPPGPAGPIDPDGPGGRGPLTVGEVSTGAYTDPAGCNMPVISERAEFYCEFDPSYLETEFAAYSAVLDLDLTDDVSLTSVTGYRNRVFRTVHRDYSRILPQPAAQDNRMQEEGTQFSQELRLAYISDNFDIVGGGIYQDYSFDRSPTGSPLNFGSNLPGERIGFSVCNPGGTFCPVGSRYTDESTENRTLAGFVDMTARLGDVFSIFGGLRYDDYKNTTVIQTFPRLPGDPASGNGLVGTFVTEDSNLSGRIGVSFQPNPDTNIFASYSRGYKPTAVGTNPAGNLFQLEPEISNAYELGIRTNVGDIQLSGNVFLTKIENFQSQRSVFVGTALVSEPINVPELESYGFELAAYGEIFEGLTINAGYQFNVLEFPDGFRGDDQTPTFTADLGGTQFLNAPKHKFTLSADYTLPLTSGLDLFVNANVVYKSETLLAARADPRYRYPAHEIINGGIGVRDPDGLWTASLFVRNLTKEREPTAYLASTFAGQTDGGLRAWPVAGLTARVVGVRVGFEF